MIFTKDGGFMYQGQYYKTLRAVWYAATNAQKGEAI